MKGHTSLVSRILASQRLSFIVLICFMLIAATVGYYASALIQKNKYAEFLSGFRNVRENNDAYKFINPLIGSISAPATDVGLYVDIKDDVSAYLKTEKLKGTLYDYSYYFRDMNTGLWFGDNDTASFFPASLFKFPIAIAAYKQVEDNPALLKKTAVYTQDISNLNATSLNSESVLVVGRAYSVEELVSIMILESDNGAKNLLLTLMDISYLNRLFEVVSAVDHKAIKPYEISSRKYAVFLRMLYGSSYLNEAHSELLLSMLAKSEFKDGLVAGVPATIPVAHKYGVYEVDEVTNGKLKKIQQLHDCGIIYHLESPYIFCFMTKGKDNQSLLKIISHVSGLIYKYQDKR